VDASPYSGKIDMIDLSKEADDLKGHTKTPLLKVIRKKCLDCCGGLHGEVRKCPIINCPLWPYRMAKNPFHTRIIAKDKKQIDANILMKPTVKLE